MTARQVTSSNVSYTKYSPAAATASRFAPPCPTLAARLIGKIKRTVTAAGAKLLRPFVQHSLTQHSIVFGDPTRLQIHPSARMLNTLFNLMGGRITVGAQTFAGHNVMLLTGSHDIRQTHQARANHITGGDITIGQGVWLCSGCIVIGPALICDHAVIGAGAVVVAGSIVGRGDLWTGIPAHRQGHTPC
jgi:acetyltransferase-like isoleucine patch superfamily enzyme